MSEKGRCEHSEAVMEGGCGACCIVAHGSCVGVFELLGGFGTNSVAVGMRGVSEDW